MSARVPPRRPRAGTDRPGDPAGGARGPAGRADAPAGPGGRSARAGACGVQGPEGETWGCGIRGPEDWERRYVQGPVPWDLGRPPPALLQLLDDLADEGLCVLIPGAGHGHDAIAWAAAGHAVVAVDTAPSAVASCRRRAAEARVGLDVLPADVLDLPRELEGEFDAVWEQTCFCAIPPASRHEYVRQMARALRPGGRFYGLFWHHGMTGGPPWDVSEDLVQREFDPCFEILWSRKVPSAPPRSREFLVAMQRRDWRPCRWKRSTNF